MKRWAWLWVVGLALIGWAPALVVSYVVAFTLAIVIGWSGPLIFCATYALIFGVGLAMLGQVRRHFGLIGAESQRFTLIGGGALLLTWGGACLAFAIQAGWL